MSPYDLDRGGVRFIDWLDAMLNRPDAWATVIESRRQRRDRKARAQESPVGELSPRYEVRVGPRSLWHAVIGHLLAGRRMQRHQHARDPGQD